MSCCMLACFLLIVLLLKDMEIDHCLASHSRSNVCTHHHDTPQVGLCKHSWGFDGRSRRLYHNGQYLPWGVQWRVGDVIGVSVDFGAGDAPTLRFFINGEEMCAVGLKSQAKTLQEAAPAFSGVKIGGGELCMHVRLFSVNSYRNRAW